MASSSRGVAAPSISSARASTVSMRCRYCGTRSVRKFRGAGRATSALGGAIGIIRVAERLNGLLAVARQQHFHFLLRGSQRGLALACERHAAFERLERVFERNIALLQFRDE